jgi:uncharacterized membrane protein YdjX (TVP38/TMEM64 family)
LGLRWQHVEKQLEEKGFLYMLLLRLIPLLPFDLISYAAGVSKVKLSAFFLATVLGILPGTFAYNFLGTSFVEGNITMIVIAIIVFVLVLMIPLLLRSKLSILKETKKDTTDDKL